MRAHRTYRWLSPTILVASTLQLGCDESHQPAGAAGARQPVADLQPSGPIQTAPLINLLTLDHAALAQNDPNFAAEELPGLGHKFQLFDAMVEDKDPLNATNDVISVVTTPTDIGIAFRDFPPGIKIAALTDQINLKYFFQDRTCGGGSPRITLLVDADGDGTFDETTGDFAAQGHVNPPIFGACAPNKWTIEDLSDRLPRWETTPLVPMVPFTCGPIGGAGTCTWDQLQTSVTATFPNHQVLGGFLIDGDACGFQPATCGKAYYDLLTLENRTLENDQDAVKK